MDGLKDIVLDKFTKLVWYLMDVDLPSREIPARINICVHTEMLYDELVFDALLGFSKGFLGLTGKKMAVCVSTPVCPLVKNAMKNMAVARDVVAERICEVSKFAEIGYHGHFYREGANALEQISHDNYDRDTVIRQIKGEIDWLMDIGIAPRIYIGGWWFLTSDIVLELERAGITVDVSVRKGRRDTFGGKYLEDAVLPPCGKPFLLPPSKRIIEIQSIFGPVMMTSIMKGHLSRYLCDKKDEPMSFIFPLHDWDIPKYQRNLSANIASLNESVGSVEWADIMDMRDSFFSERLKGDGVDKR